jgi:YfiH family protein
METISSSLLSSYHEVAACFTTRHGGVSQAPYSDANLAFHVGDNPLDVLQNHTLLAQKMNYSHHSLIHMRQIHSDHIVIITDKSIHFDNPPECDALITNHQGTPLMVMSADCTPILLYDPAQRAIGVIHAGRAGALKQILPKTITAMIQTYQSNLDDIRIVLGPSIHGCCYEINKTIASETIDLGYQTALHHQKEKVFLDVNTILLMQLNALGIQEERIEIIDHCTSCLSDTYFSYRADAQHTGRIAGVIMLQSA